MIQINLRRFFAVDFFDYFEFLLEMATLLIVIALAVIIFLSMKKNDAFYRGAGPWTFAAMLLLMIPLFFDVIQDFAKIFDPNLVRYGFTDSIDEIDMIFFLLSAILGIYGFYRQFIHTQTLDTQLRHSEQSVKELAELLPQTVFEIDFTGKITYANPKGLETFGYTQEELKRGLNVSELFIPEDLNRIRKNINKMMQGELFEDHEYTALHRKRTTFPVLIYSSPIIRDQKPVGLRGVILDISDIKAIENALRESEQRYRQLVKQAPTGIYESILNFSTGEVRVVYANDLLLELFEVSHEEALSLNLYDMLTDESKEIWLGRAAKIMAREEIPNTIEYQVVTKSGKKLWVLLRSKMIFEEDNTAKATVSVHDITDIKNSEKDVRDSETRFKTIFENVTDGIILANPEDGEIFLANQPFCDMFGYSQQEIRTLSLAEIQPNKTYKGFNDDTKAINVQTSTFASEIPLLKKNGSLFHADISVSPITLEDKIYHIGIFRNVEERKVAEEIRVELQKRRDNFIRMVNHELRTPLTVLFGYNEFLQKKLDSMNNQQREDVFSIITKNLNRLERLIADSQAITQLERGLFQINLQSIDFKEFLIKILTPYQNLLDEQIDFKFVNFDEVSQVKYSLDSDRIQQVFDNVLDNAIKNSSKETRKIKIEIRNSITSIEVDIIDNGAGIDPKDLERIFDQFVTIETEYSIQGTGIGLYLSREIMNSHGGSITAYSEGKGHGMKFTLNFPKK
ncbi:MAG: PAS domain-containing sensor histidine kinase [Candidatus Hodarchaeales archaeon]|jgi:PAS domain S-box-containing protein